MSDYVGLAVATIMSDIGLERHLQSVGLSLRTPVGDHCVLAEMRRQCYNVGGEPNGHIILSDYATTGDGFVAALQVLAAVTKLDQPISKACRRFDPIPQVTRNVSFRKGHKQLTEDAKVREAIANAEQLLKGQGRLIVRPSGTEPVIRVTGEGENSDLIEEAIEGIVETLIEIRSR